MESLHDVLRALINAGHKTGALSEDDYHAAHAWVDSDDPEATRLQAEADKAAEEADRAEYERLQAKYSGHTQPAASEPAGAGVPAAGGGFHQETPGTESSGFSGG